MCFYFDTLREYDKSVSHIHDTKIKEMQKEIQICKKRESRGAEMKQSLR